MTTTRTANDALVAYGVIAVLYAAVLTFSGVGKLRLDPPQVLIIADSLLAVGSRTR